MSECVENELSEIPTVKLLNKVNFNHYYLLSKNRDLMEKNEIMQKGIQENRPTRENHYFSHVGSNFTLIHNTDTWTTKFEMVMER